MDINKQTAQPVRVPRTRRNHNLAVLTSLPAGKCVPIAAIPMLREDSVTGRCTVNVEMLETKELLMNPVNLRVTAYVVPFLAFERFEGSRDQLDRSYMGEPQVEGGDVVPFINSGPIGAHGANAIHKYLGVHSKEGDTVNYAYIEAYNVIWNFRARNRSQNITPRAMLAGSLAPAFWNRSRFEHVVPDFDQAVIDGEVALNIVEQNIPIKGIGKATSAFPTVNTDLFETQGAANYPFSAKIDPADVNGQFYVRGSTGDPGTLQVFAELQENAITVSLSNIEMAKRTQAFAKLRERYEGYDDEWIIDMLMDGLTIPDQALKQPILIADRLVNFGQLKRYATDSGNLDESAVSGAASVTVPLRVPRLNTGGVIMLIAEALPEQLFERQRDPFFYSANQAAWPEFVRDTLDPEKVDVVTNGEIDTDHATPAATFGYAPMNWKWNAWGPRVGGKFFRPTANTATDDARQRLWAVENVNPTLSADFYLANAIHQKPFLDLEVDPFEATVVGNAVLEGNTVFGGLLVESTGNYEAVAEKAPVERIDKD